MLPKEKPSSQSKRSNIAFALIALAIFLLIMYFRLPHAGSIPADLGSNARISVLATYPHDTDAFTQGLVYADGYFYESTGLYGKSTLRKVEPATGKVVQELKLADQYFAEGLALYEDQLYQLTWKEHTGFIYDKAFALLGSFSYPTEGWGLTTDGNSLILSDGSATLYFLDPQTLQTTRTVQVSQSGQPVEQLNELEYIQGEVYANIWYQDVIVRIDPSSGQVLGQIDLSSLREGENAPDPADVLNGIAYDAKESRLFVTGKNWPYVYEIALVNVD